MINSLSLPSLLASEYSLSNSSDRFARSPSSVRLLYDLSRGDLQSIQYLFCRVTSRADNVLGLLWMIVSGGANSRRRTKSVAGSFCLIGEAWPMVRAPVISAVTVDMSISPRNLDGFICTSRTPSATNIEHADRCISLSMW